MTDETLERVIQIAKNLDQVIIVGFGEVFLHPRIKEILKLLDKNNVGIALSTNGTTLSEEICKFLCSLTMLQNLNVSVDSFDPEIYRIIRGCSQEKLMIGLQNLSNSGLRVDQVTLSFVCLDANFHLFPEIPEKVKKLGFNRIILQSIVEHTNCDTRIPDKNSALLYEEFHKKCEDFSINVNYCGQQNIEEHILNRQWHKKSKSQYGTKKCLVPWEIPFVDSGGRVFACCHQACDESAVLGDLNKSSFDSIWFGKKLKKFRHDLLNESTMAPGCKKCHNVTNGIHPLIEWNAKFERGQSYFLNRDSVVVCYKNIGKRAWHRKFPIRLGTSYPRDRLSRFFTKDWISPNRVCGFSEAKVAPGNYATFRCKLKKNKFFHNCETFQLVYDGELWFPESEINIDLDHKTIAAVASYGNPRKSNSQPRQLYHVIKKAKDLALHVPGFSRS
jgi:radical SAM protein with 4Fe4S-binding SPASM domain